ncbi:hypothetical protein E4656_07145 [Natronospirillum operosum]|uniref:Uncharacterized protein n=1 Tax=Natronospirillum operosum TaxID=2759953 RepID=A0A4Z0WBN9_9GAMM|nr:hypothetical protein [Natronospirillum operosum]TGG93955.1 hypothetical protein E4656_07145 [Natronospirillum operosum]
MPATGTWEPEQDQLKPDPSRVRTWLQRDWQQPDDLKQLDDLDQASLQRWIDLPEERWAALLDSLSTDQLVGLMRLCTLAEQHLAGCAAGEQSVVIHAFRRYRQQLGRPDPELTRWIRSHSDNRFLPYGPAL